MDKAKRKVLPAGELFSNPNREDVTEVLDDSGVPVCLVEENCFPGREQSEERDQESKHKKEGGHRTWFPVPDCLLCESARAVR